MEYDGTESLNYQYVVLEVDGGAAQLTRDELVGILQAENVIARRYFYPGCHRMEPYRSLQDQVDLSARLPETEALSERLMTLPTGTAVGSGQIGRICDILCAATQHATKARQWLEEQDLEITCSGT